MYGGGWEKSGVSALLRLPGPAMLVLRGIEGIYLDGAIAKKM